ncbi:MAG: carbohydrate ABC transporter substrate-binding protein [Acidimicrobiaceae bacterium]|nr:carbohydrate ABC transporter substrate-binding protein [Acidimicrobiaceae bacterium]MYK74983.1 carbohydrate ABC transporter substrate-binding protein [Acidimicrobiaceae bacterium]
MKNQSRLWMILGAVLAFALVATACGDDEPAAVDTSAADAAEAMAAEAMAEADAAQAQAEAAQAEADAAQAAVADAQAEADAAAAMAAEAEAALAAAQAEGEGSVDPEVVAELEAQMAEAMAEAEAAADRAADAEEAMEAAMMELEMSLAGSVVTVLGPETGSEAEGFLAGFEPLRERTGIVVRYSGTRDATTELNLAVEAGDPPDIVIIPQPGRILQFGESGDAVAIPDSIMANIGGSYDQFWFDLATTGGNVYGVPNKGDVKSLVWYSPQGFADNGYEIPQTWAELESLMEQMKGNGQTPWCVGIESGAATGWAFTDWMEDMMLRLHGPAVYDQWVSHEIPFNDPRVVEVAEFVGSIWFAEGNVSGGRDLISQRSFREMAAAHLNGECMMHRQANFAGAHYLEAGASSLGPDGDVNVFYLPTISAEFGTVVLGAGTHAVAFTDKPETLAVLEYIGTAEYANARIASDKGGFLSPNRDHDTSLYSSSFDRALAEILVSANPFRFDASDLMPGEVGAGEFWRSGTDYVSGSKTAQEFADDTEDAWPS